MRLRASLAAALLLLGAALPASAAMPPSDLVRAELVADVSEVAAGEPFTVGLRLRMAEGYHTYWKNPGDSGLPTKIAWTLPEGFDAGPIEWPAPIRFDVGGVANYGYDGEVVLLTKLTPPSRVEAGAAIPLAAKASWLVCNDETCVPGRAELSLDLKGAAGAAVRSEEGAAKLAAYRAKLPVAAPWPVAFEGDATQVLLRVKEPALASGRIAAATFFPLGGGLDLSAKQELAVAQDGLTLKLKPAAEGERPATFPGVLVLEEALDKRTARAAFAIGSVEEEAPKVAIGPKAAIAPPAAAATAGAAETGLLEAVLFALLGGIVLNLMPCVFPVLSLKVLGVAQQASEAPARIRLHGIAYTGGILASFAALAGVLLALRAGGDRIGWGFQLQSPGFVTLLAYVLMAMALSLSGVVHFGTSIAGVGSGLASRPGLSGSFFTGVLATVVATPCTAPFMGAAIGWALTQPAVTSLVVFLALGLGLALPFLVLSFVPSMHRLLPKPGAWMETLKQLLAFPLYGTVAWLVWVLHLQAGPEGLAAALAGIVLVSFAAWAWGSSRFSSARLQRVGALATIAATAGAVWLARMPGEAPIASPEAKTVAASTASLSYEPFRPARLAELRAQTKPVFVNLTAAWCVTCIVNERTAIATEPVREAFGKAGVAYLKGDWTNRDPEITSILEQHGRSGVPLYLLYGPGADEPVVLPQVLTTSTILEHLQAL